MKEITFMGHRITQEGIQSDPEKVKAISEMPSPGNVHELRRFLGCINYLAKFLPNLSMTLEPLANLLRKDVPFVWSDSQENAFCEAKRMVTNAPVLSFYDQKKPLLLENDASEYGIGSALFQNDKPIAYASRSLSDTGKRHAQIEKEMLAVSYGLTRFHQYTYGRDVTVITDHKPLVSIVVKPLSKAPKRLQNLLIRTQGYNYSLEYRKGTNIPVADALSRAPVSVPRHSQMIKSVFYAPIKKKHLAEVASATQADSDLTLLKATVLQGWPDDKAEVALSVRPYFPYRDEITVQDGILLRGERIIIPNSLRSLMKRQIHSGHLGINSCLRRARESVFWPGMSSEIRQYVENCQTCISHSDKQAPEPMIMKETTGIPFDQVATDLFNLKGKDFLITVDCYSNFIEVDRLYKATSKAVITVLKKHFARYGIPRTVYSDNGPQYSSQDFRKFARKWEFTHVTSSPGYPQSNGAAEAAVKSVKNMMKKCLADKQDMYLGLLAMRNTPTEGLESSPSQRLMGRRTRTPLPILDKALDHQNIKNSKPGIDKKKAKAASYHTERRTLPELVPGQATAVQPITPNDRKWVQGTVRKQVDARSYEVQTDSGIYRRNRKMLRATPSVQHRDTESDGVTPVQSEPEQSTPTPETSNDTQPAKSQTPVKSGPRVTRFGRTVKTPLKFKDNVNKMKYD